MRTSWLLLAAIVGLLATHANAQGCDCDKIRLSPADTPVCDRDGVTYANRCLATCQGAKGVGPCRGSSGGKATGAGSSSAGRPFDPKFVDTGATLTARDLTRYQKDGFKLAAKLRTVGGRAWTPTMAKGHSSAASKAPAGTLTGVRFTSTGLLYMKTVTAKAAAAGSGAGGSGAGSRGSMPVTAPPANRTAAPGTRKLLVVGTDDRWEIGSWNGAHNYPWRTVGFIKTGCSGALVGHSTVLTAGHCVYDTSRRTFYSDLNFIAARHDGGDHCHSRAWWGGCTDMHRQHDIRWTFVETWFQNAASPVCCAGQSVCTCQTNQDFAHDIAIIRLAERAGDRYGWLGWAWDCATQSIAATSAGYPGTAPRTGDRSMTRMFGTAGTLNPFSGCLGRTDPRGVVASNLDTTSGQSGSAIWDSSNRVRAIHVSGGPGHRTLVREYAEWVERLRQ